jgi:hypothetical protein
LWKGKGESFLLLRRGGSWRHSGKSLGPWSRSAIAARRGKFSCWPFSLLSQRFRVKRAKKRDAVSLELGRALASGTWVRIALVASNQTRRGQIIWLHSCVLIWLPALPGLPVSPSDPLSPVMRQRVTLHVPGQNSHRLITAWCVHPPARPSSSFSHSIVTLVTLGYVLRYTSGESRLVLVF